MRTRVTLRLDFDDERRLGPQKIALLGESRRDAPWPPEATETGAGSVLRDARANRGSGAEMKARDVWNAVLIRVAYRGVTS